MESLTSSNLFRVFGVDPIDFDDLAEAVRQLLGSAAPNSDLLSNSFGGINVLGSNLVETGS